MSLEITKSTRSIDLPRDKPQVDHAEHANLDRPGAVLHPSAGGLRRRAPSAGSRDWSRYMASPSWR